MAAQPVLKRLNGRRGDAEQAHDALRNGLAGGTMPSGWFGANAFWRMGALLAVSLHALTAWRTLGEDPDRANWERTRRVRLIHADRLVERGRQLNLRMRKARTEELQAALESLGERPTVPGKRRSSRSPPRSAGNPEPQPGTARLFARAAGFQALAADAVTSGRRKGQEITR